MLLVPLFTLLVTTLSVDSLLVLETFQDPNCTQSNQAYLLPLQGQGRGCQICGNQGQGIAYPVLSATRGFQWCSYPPPVGGSKQTACADGLASCIATTLPGSCALVCGIDGLGYGRLREVDAAHGVGLLQVAHASGDWFVQWWPLTSLDCSTDQDCRKDYFLPPPQGKAYVECQANGNTRCDPTSKQCKGMSKCSAVGLVGQPVQSALPFDVALINSTAYLVDVQNNEFDSIVWTSDAEEMFYAWGWMVGPIVFMFVFVMCLL